MTRRHASLAAVAFAALAAATPIAGGAPVTYAPSAIEQAYRAGKAAGDDDAAARVHYQRGIDLARAVLAKDANAPDALLWLAGNLAGEALTHGKVFALRVIPEIEATLLHLERVNPAFGYAAGARGLANLYWKAPAFISVGSSKKATAYFELALARAPTFPGNQAMAAAYFVGSRECARAKPLAQAVAARTDLDAFGPDAAEWKQIARGVLRDCGG
jgi:hypothetical protein